MDAISYDTSAIIKHMKLHLKRFEQFTILNLMKLKKNDEHYVLMDIVKL